MNHPKKSVLICLLFCFSLFTHAAAVKEESINDLLVLSGLKNQIEAVPSTVIAMIQQGLPGLPDQKKKDLESVFGNVFNPDLVLKDVAIEIGKAMTEQEANDVIAWYESNTGGRIARAEEESSTPQAMMEFQKVAPTLAENAALMTTVQELLEATKLIEKSIEIQEMTMLATMIGMSQASQPEQPVNVDRLKSIVSMQINQAKASLEQMLTLQLAFAYKDIDKASMNEYLTVLKSPAMQKFNDSNVEGSRLALSKAIDRLLAAE